MTVKTKTNDSLIQIGTSQLFLSLFLLLLAFFIFINSISSYQERKTSEVVGSVRASFPAVISSEDLFQLRKYKNPVVSPTIFNELDEAFLFLFQDRRLKVSADKMSSQIDVPVELLFKQGTALPKSKLEEFLKRLAKIIMRAESISPLNTEIVFGYKSNLNRKFKDNITTKRSSVIMSALIKEKVGNGAVAVGLENGHAGFLRFKFRSRTGNGSLDRKELISD